MKRSIIGMTLALALTLPAVAQQYGEHHDDRRDEHRTERRADRLNGVVVDVNRRLNYFTIRTDEGNRAVKIDVRHMEPGHGVNLRRVRRGDHFRVRGDWENHDTFNAWRVE